VKLITRFYEEDLKKLVIEHLDVKPSQVTCIYTEECRGYGMGEHMEPVFYIEVEEDA
jgi:hypothetical protein